MNPINPYATLAAMPASEPVRLAQLLSIPATADFDDVALAGWITRGLPVASVAVLSGMFGATHIVGPVVPEATLRRFRKSRKPLPKEHSERLYELSRVVDAVARAFHGDPGQMKAFMARPHPLLNDETPFDLARSSSAGADAVLNLLRRAEAGVAL